MSDLQQSFSDPSVCGQPENEYVPGSPAVSGQAEVLCFTFTSQNGPATPYAVPLYAGLVKGSGEQLLVEVEVYVPQSVPAKTFAQLATPLFNKLHWRYLKTT